ncbi:hypothetical protein AO250_13285 [Pseudomonas syringae pv. actinidiae ICMP 19497]|nr:hypothetical protein AO250_13285 [Pseudomonas syringae pv. actinidiae ICMP 19497]
MFAANELIVCECLPQDSQRFIRFLSNDVTTRNLQYLQVTFTIHSHINHVSVEIQVATLGQPIETLKPLATNTHIVSAAYSIQKNLRRFKNVLNL